MEVVQREKWVATKHREGSTMKGPSSQNNVCRIFYYFKCIKMLLEDNCAKSQADCTQFNQIFHLLKHEEALDEMKVSGQTCLIV